MSGNDLDLGVLLQVPDNGHLSVIAMAANLGAVAISTHEWKSGARTPCLRETVGGQADCASEL
jgi:hypothetical protein